MPIEKVNNGYYFIKSLHEAGLSVQAIAKGARLSAHLIKEVILTKQKQLDENQFHQILGFYCCHLCNTKYSQSHQVDRLKKFKQLFEKHSPEKLSNQLLNILKQKPWLKQKKLLIKNISGKEAYLTLREQELLYYLLQDKTQLQAAAQLKISKRTVEYHWQRIRDRLSIVSLNQLRQNWFVKSEASDKELG